MTGRLPFRFEELDPEFARLVRSLVAAMEARGFTVHLFEGWRRPERGDYLQARGRSQVGRASKHCHTAAAGRRASLAVDLVSGEVVAGWAVWWGASDGLDLPPHAQNDRKRAAALFFEALGQEAFARGLEWGGSWDRFTDPAHVQL